MDRSHAFAAAQELGLELTSDARGRATESTAIRRDAGKGKYVRVAPSVFLDRGRWEGLGPDDRFRAFVVGMATTMEPDVVFSHFSAAALLGLPSLHAWPRRVQVTIPPASGGRSTGNVQRYGAALRDDEVVEVAGFLVTSPARTVMDVARMAPFAPAVALADAALHRKRKPAPLLTMADLAAELDEQRGRYAFGKMRRVAEFSTTLSDSVRESESRVLIHELGFPQPVLQQPWFDRSGHVGDTDFWWPEHGLAGECDGLGKYLKPELLHRRTTAQAVIAEKRREDRIRALGADFARWEPALLAHRPGFARLLRDAGLPQRPRSRY
ncbi:type IV toxin-antitoxin system AbiEi family antitoxin domain-containing protein [Gryllotalpicola ginsengisoli]|uniref:type IV toxin-antitoxin system AbiEi family antitoxin domain-containing protein n=1 Tax=Gryllotalpicola ginsengisoli TaxID=444608 RepID=UPI0003B739DA|nr:hypothetical protein [Gryllotalpicola ginsengisoli]